MNMAAVIRELMAAGLQGEDLCSAVERIEDASKPILPARSSNAERCARYRAKRATSDHVETMSNHVATMSQHKSSPPLLPLSPPSSSSPPITPLTTTPPSLPLITPSQKHREPKSLALADKFFDEFWQAYPKREGANPKTPALKSYLRATGTGKVSPAELLDAAKRYAASVNPADARFIPMASTWLNQERWTEHAGKPTGSSSSPSAVVSQLQVARTPVKETEKDYRDLLILYREKYGRSPMTVNGTVYYPTDWLDRHRVTGVQSPTNDLLREA